MLRYCTRVEILNPYLVVQKQLKLNEEYLCYRLH